MASAPREGPLSASGAGTRANAAREGSGARPPGQRSPAEPQRPWEPGSARVLGDRRARGGPRPSGSCRPHRVRGLPEARGKAARCGQRLPGPGCCGSAPQPRGRTGQPARNFPPRTEPVQTSYWRRSLSGCRRLSLPLLVFGAPPEIGGVLGSRSQSPRMGSHTTSPPRAQPVPPPWRPERPAGSATGATSPASRGPRSRCRPRGSGRQPASCARSRTGQHRPLPRRSAPGDSFFCGSSPQNRRSRLPSPLQTLERYPPLSTPRLPSLLCFSSPLQQSLLLLPLQRPCRFLSPFFFFFFPTSSAFFEKKKIERFLS